MSALVSDNIKRWIKNIRFSKAHPYDMDVRVSTQISLHAFTRFLETYGK